MDGGRSDDKVQDVLGRTRNAGASRSSYASEACYRSSEKHVDVSGGTSEMADRMNGTTEPGGTLAQLRKFAQSRDAVREAGVELALSLDEQWSAARVAKTGPVDVVDMFAGCGGMSAGFLAANALLPAYRLATAIDIDDVAMKTYEANLGLKPLKLDLHAYSESQEGLVQVVNEARSAPDAPLVLIGCAPCQGFSSHRNAAGGSGSSQHAVCYVRKSSDRNSSGCGHCRKCSGGSDRPLLARCR